MRDISIFLIFISLVSALLVAVDFYFFSKFRKFIRQRQKSEGIVKIIRILTYCMIGVLLTLFLSRIFFPQLNVLHIALFMLISVWYLPKLLISIFLLLTDIYTALRRAFTKRSNVGNDDKLRVNAGRRRFVSNVSWGMAAVPFVAAGKGVALTAYNFELFEIEIPLRGIAKNLEDIKIVQISDLHFGSFYSTGPSEKVRDIINRIEPDILLITGDFVNSNPAELENGMAEIASIKTKYGIYGCLGNHDHYMSDADHEKLKESILGYGVDLMINTNKVIDIGGAKFNLASTDNVGHSQAFGDFDKALSGIDKDLPVILMCHDPSNWDNNIRNKHKVDLMVAGHTHGGQIGMEKFGLNISLVSFMYKRWAGLYTDGNSYLYVNRGIGMSGPPLRIGINPEITLFKFKSI